MLDLTVIILTFNEDSNLPFALDSVRGLAKEVFVVDSYSTDRTVDLALERTGDNVRVVQHTFENYAKQWQWALRRLPITTSWTMKLDADEQVSPRLRTELEQTLPTMPQAVTGLYVPLAMHFMGQRLFTGGFNSRLLRLWRTGQAQFGDRPVNETVFAAGQTRYLRGPLLHLDHRSLSDWLRKHDRYSSLEAIEMVERTHNRELKANLFGSPEQSRRWWRRLFHRFPLRHVLYFLYRYVLRLGFLSGRAALRYCILYTCYLYWIDLKVWEYRHTGRRPHVEWPSRGTPHPVVAQSVLQQAVSVEPEELRAGYGVQATRP